MGQSRVGARASDPAADGRMATSVRADMSRAEDDRSSVATPAGDASVSSWSSSEALFARAASPPLADIRHFHNMSTKEFDAYAYSLNQSQTGCYRQGALPLALAKNDTCLDGFFCTCGFFGFFLWFLLRHGPSNAAERRTAGDTTTR